MRLMAEFPSISVKLSGLGMTDFYWSVDSIRGFIIDGIEIFGIDRSMFASNFPVDSVMSDYDTLLQCLQGNREGFFRQRETETVPRQRGMHIPNLSLRRPEQ